MTSLLHPARGSRPRELFAVLNARQPANRGPNPFYGGKDLPTQALAEGRAGTAPWRSAAAPTQARWALAKPESSLLPSATARAWLASRRTVATEGRTS